MQEIQPSQIHSWVSSSDHRHVHPKIMGLRCGHCGERSRFVIDDPTALKVDAPAAQVSCPNCDGVLRLYTVAQPRKTDARGWMFVHPHAEERARLDLSGLEWPAPLAQAYEECVAALDAGLWTAAAGQARRTLEGVIMHMLGPKAKSRAMLGNLLRDLPSQVELDKPIRDAAEALREGGNLAAHFDLEVSPSPDVARAMIQLLEDLIEYLFILPENVAEMRRQLDRSAPVEDADPDAAPA